MLNYNIKYVNITYIESYIISALETFMKISNNRSNYIVNQTEKKDIIPKQNDTQEVSFSGSGNNFAKKLKKILSFLPKRKTPMEKAESYLKAAEEEKNNDIAYEINSKAAKIYEKNWKKLNPEEQAGYVTTIFRMAACKADENPKEALDLYKGLFNHLISANTPLAIDKKTLSKIFNRANSLSELATNQKNYVIAEDSTRFAIKIVEYAEREKIWLSTKEQQALYKLKQRLAKYSN